MNTPTIFDLVVVRRGKPGESEIDSRATETTHLVGVQKELVLDYAVGSGTLQATIWNVESNANRDYLDAALDLRLHGARIAKANHYGIRYEGFEIDDNTAAVPVVVFATRQGVYGHVSQWDEVEYRCASLVPDGTAETVGFGVRVGEDGLATARDDADAWERDGYVVEVQRRRVSHSAWEPVPSQGGLS